MIIYFNASKLNELDVFLIKNKKVISQIKIQGNIKISEKLLPTIDKILNENNIKPSQLQAVITIVGPGPFTSIRIAIAIANTLAYLLKIKAVGIINQKNYPDLQLINQGLKKLAKTKTGSYLKAYYDRPANITLK